MPLIKRVRDILYNTVAGNSSGIVLWHSSCLCNSPTAVTATAGPQRCDALCWPGNVGATHEYGIRHLTLNLLGEKHPLSCNSHNHLTACQNGSIAVPTESWVFVLSVDAVNHGQSSMGLPLHMNSFVNSMILYHPSLAALGLVEQAASLLLQAGQHSTSSVLAHHVHQYPVRQVALVAPVGCCKRHYR